MTNPILAYTIHPELTREVFVAEMEAHRAADRFLHGVYWNHQQSRGCAVGCAIRTINNRLKPRLGHNFSFGYDNHQGLAEALGWPYWLAMLEDSIFEKLHAEESLSWPVNLAKAIQQGADLSQVVTPLLKRFISDFYIPKAPRNIAPATYILQNLDNPGPKEEWLELAEALNSMCENNRKLRILVSLCDFMGGAATLNSVISSGIYDMVDNTLLSYETDIHSNTSAIATILLEELAKIPGVPA